MGVAQAIFPDSKIKTSDFICARGSGGFSREASNFYLNKYYFKKILTGNVSGK